MTPGVSVVAQCRDTLEVLRLAIIDLTRKWRWNPPRAPSPGLLQPVLPSPVRLRSLELKTEN
jgi:hypothetical protein